MLADLDPRLTWYVARASGLMAWAVLTASVVWGLALSTRVVRRRGATPWLLALHRYLGGLAVVFTATHLVALWLDSYVHFGPAELFVPWASSWRPGAVAAGVIALYVLAVVQATSWLMRRLPRRVWHGIHLLSFPLFGLATAHGVWAGTDRANRLVQWIGITAVTLVVFLAVLRVLAPRSTARRSTTGQRSPLEAVASSA